MPSVFVRSALLSGTSNQNVVFAGIGGKGEHVGCANDHGHDDVISNEACKHTEFLKMQASAA